MYELNVVTVMGEYKREGEELKDRREECTAEEMDNFRDSLTRLVLCIRPVCFSQFCKCALQLDCASVGHWDVVGTSS